MTEPKSSQPNPGFRDALAKLLLDVRQKSTRARAAAGKWMEEHEQGIALAVIVLQVVGDVVPKVNRLAEEHDDGSYRHLLAGVEPSDAFGLLLSVAGGDEAIEEHLEAALTRPQFVDELIVAVESARLNPPLTRQLTHGLDLLKCQDYVLSVPVLIQGLEGAFWEVPEQRGLIVRKREKMYVREADGRRGRTLYGVTGALDLLDEVDAPFRDFLARLVFGGRGNRFRHGNATEGWRLEALLLVVALVGWLERFGDSEQEGYLRRAFSGRTESQAVVYAAFPALKLLGELRPEAIEFTMDLVMLFARPVSPTLEEGEKADNFVIAVSAEDGEPALLT